MSASSFKEIREKLHVASRDNFGLQWGDAELDDLINEAQREYVVRTGELIGETTDITTIGGKIHVAPSDFIYPVKFISAEGEELPIVSWTRLVQDFNDFRKMKSNRVEAVCFDFDGYGKYRFFPALEESKAVGKLIYCRYPANNVIEIDNDHALIEYALFRMFMLTGKDNAGNHYDAFMNEVIEDGASKNVIRNKQTARRGTFF